MANLLTLRAIRKDFGIKVILNDANASLDSRDKVGLIGTNGSGKSTLLKAIAGLEALDGGEIAIDPKANIVYLPQQPDLDEERTVLEQIFADSSEAMSLVREYESLSQAIARAEGVEREQLISRFASVTEKMDSAGTWELETKAKVILSKLGIRDFDAKIAHLSGGYRKRIALATALLGEPDLLLADEPTNHLDAESVEWLQDYLKQFPGALLLVTHDRYFLDRVTDRILEIDRGELYSYSGNYSYYLEKKAAAEASDAASARKHQGVLRRELEWLKRGPKARSTKQKARIDRIHAMQEQTFKGAQEKVAIDTPGRRIGKKVIDLKGISKGYNGRTLIRDFSFEFGPEDRIGIIGGNGTGKSTLLNIATGRLPPDSGTVEIGSTIHVGYFDQHSDDLSDAGHLRVIDYIKEFGTYVKTADGSQISASQMLERFLFAPEQQYAPIHKLSGGEKRRLFLLRILMGAPNVLILDEPTNDLDTQTLAILEDYLEEFNGCAIAVSHDRYFLDRAVDCILAIEAGGAIRKYPGNYSTYLEYKKVAEEREKEVAEPAVKRSALPPKSPEQKRKRRLSNYQRRELEQLERQIATLETQKTEIETLLAQNPPDDYTQLQALSEQLEHIDAEIDPLTDRWMELAELED